MRGKYMQIEIDNKLLEVEIIKKNNKNTYIRVKDGKIIVTTNYLSSNNSIKKLINDNVGSIQRMIKIDNKKRERGKEFYYFGKRYDIIYGFRDTEIVNDKIYTSD